MAWSWLRTVTACGSGSEVKYVDWVETVVRTTVEAFDAGSGFSTNEAAVVEKLSLDLGEDHREPVWDAFRDLERMGLLESASRWDIKNGRLSAQKIGRDWRLEESEVERYRAESVDSRSSA